MTLPNLTDQNIQDTYQRVVQKDENGQLFDGTGSLIPLKIDGPDLIVSGAVRAQSYIVSESVTVVTSGSTVFGNSGDDKHRFTGSLHITGGLVINMDILNSSQIILRDPTNNYDFKLQQGNTNATLDFSSNADQNLVVKSDSDAEHMFLDGGTGNVGIGATTLPSKLTVDGDITATNITASVHVKAVGFTGSLSGNATTATSAVNDKAGFILILYKSVIISSEIFKLPVNL